MTYSDGSKYVGEFSNYTKFDEHIPNGLGTVMFVKGDKYVGNFKNGKRYWKGTYTYANGKKYIGEFKDNKRSGQGTLFADDGSIIFSGIWDEGKRSGTAADLETIMMDVSGGVYVVPVRFNDAITLDAIVDSGASDVSVPADIVLTLIRTKTVTQSDFLGQQTYVLADGSKVPSQQFKIRSLRVGNKTVENVVASIASVQGTILLGQSFLAKFKSWSVDNEQHTLVLR